MIKQECIDKNYPGGNIQINSIDRNIIHLEQEIRDSGEWWFYWNFRARNLEGEKVRFVFDNGEVLGPYGPAVSRDGREWKWAGAETLMGRDSFVYGFGEEEREVYFAFSIPYQLSYFEDFRSKYQENSLVTNGILGMTEGGREIPYMRLGNPDGKKHIYFTCRHHACESTAAYVLEGTIAFLMRQTEAFWSKYCVHIFPFVDLDGVENGDQGKARLPHDHNRDYLDEPIYQFTRKLYEYVEQYPPYIFADYHSPWKWGEINDVFYIVKSSGKMALEQDAYAEILEQRVTANKEEIPYKRSNNLDAGTGWNTGNNPTSTRYFISQGAKLAFGFEIPYFGADGIVYTAERLRSLGQSVGESFVCYCEKQN